MMLPLFLALAFAGEPTSAAIDFKCIGCQLGVSLIEKLPLHKLEPLITAVAIPVCIAINGTGECDPTTVEGSWSCQDLCVGMMKEEVSVLANILGGKNYTSENKCEVFSFCEKPKFPPQPLPDMRVQSNLSDLDGEPKYSNWPEHGGKLSGYFVHFTDLHLQRDYQIGSETDCGQPICCRSEGGKGRPGHSAGAFGDYRCDASPMLFTSMAKAMKELPVDVDFVLNTGDEPAHDVWNQTPDLNLKAVEQVARDLSIAGFNDRPVANTLGNHESEPVNQYKGPGGDDWLYQGSTSAWAPWLPTDARLTMPFGGFYQMRLAPGLRALVMHTTMFDDDNWYFVANGTDFVGQFAWARDVLLQARERDEKVYVLHHHPQTSLDGFSSVFNELMESFSDVIVATFTGHVHTAFFRVLRDTKTKSIPLHTSFCPGSGDPGGNLNPTFRVYRYDTKTFELLDYTQHYLNLTEANLNYTKSIPEVWSQDPPATQLFGIKDLSATEFDRLAVSWLNSSDEDPTWQAYQAQYTRHAQGKKAVHRIEEACKCLTYSKNEYPQCSRKISIDPTLPNPPPYGVPEVVMQTLLQTLFPYFQEEAKERDSVSFSD